ncbi:glycoside hydrolase family 97 protein [Opitutus sp. ER46]|uniref:glycoside hydrolase family 97 protein n=1 Tax=Opitutus sp. ER46 TaxID=2161864 RepID=UPI000D314489|nr:glycoside hydrolase family 97 protein [Opitutus sp. ER46]PTX95808.1 alpha-glucosidase [Opitutus sp. ER46]
MKSSVLLLLGLGAALLLSNRAPAATALRSPDGQVAVTFDLSAAGEPVYGITYLGQPVVQDSRLGLEPDWLGGFALTGLRTTSERGQWSDPFGERREVPDNYNQLTVELRGAEGRRLQLEFRVYNEGAALRYVLPATLPAPVRLTGERTEFRFPAGTFGWEEHGTEGIYRRARIADFAPWCERPLTVELPGGGWAAVAEAANVAFPRLLLSPAPGLPGALVSALGGTSANTATREFAQAHDPSATLRPGEATPWRMFLVGRRPGDLLERNYLMLNLNPPSRLADTSWIRPGKVMRDTTLTTAGSKAIIDFAATAGLSYVHLDWKWYGPVEYEEHGEAIVRAPNLDVPEIVRYGRSKGVGLILYVDRRQIRRERDALFARFRAWGVAGVKIGFVDVGPQAETAWITETIQQAAEYRLMLNIHDGYRSTGLSRTYPQLMTVEGIRGNENFPTAEQNCTLPFTRYLGGVGDYTVCYYDKRLKTTHAHQLAMAVVSFSPLQWIFWYDKAAAYQGEPEVEFFRRVPTVWDETRVIDGRVGEYAVLARRSGREWFVGVINGGTARSLPLPLDFLPKGESYTAHVYADDPTVPTRTHVRVSTVPVTAAATLDVPLRASGGQAVWLEPVRTP